MSGGRKGEGDEKRDGARQEWGVKQLSTTACFGWVETVNSCCIGLASVAAQGCGLDGLCPVFGSRLTWRAARLTVA